MAAQFSAAFCTVATAGFEAESKQMPRISVVPGGQVAECPPTVIALFALSPLVADGTVPRAATLISLPVSEPSLTLVPLTALLAIFPVVTDLFFSCLVPTVFLPRAAQALPVSAMTKAMTATTIAGEGTPILQRFLSPCCMSLLASAYEFPRSYDM